MKDWGPPLGALEVVFPLRFPTPPAFLAFFLLLLGPAPPPSSSCHARTVPIVISEQWCINLGT